MIAWQFFLQFPSRNKRYSVKRLRGGRQNSLTFPHPVGPIMRIFLGMTSCFMSSPRWCLRQRFLNAIATALLASSCPTMNLFNCSTTSFGFNAADNTCCDTYIQHTQVNVWLVNMSQTDSYHISAVGDSDMGCSGTCRAKALKRKSRIYLPNEQRLHNLELICAVHT